MFTQVYGYYTVFDTSSPYISALISKPEQKIRRSYRAYSIRTPNPGYPRRQRALKLPPLPASALTIQDFHPNCDIRQLNLSRDQYESLRGLRGEYKQAVEKLNLQNRGSERPLRDNLLRRIVQSAL